MGQGGERMRKILPMILCLLLLGGCAKGGEPGITPEEIQARLTADCRFTAAFTYENIEGCAEVEKTGEVFSITLTEPEVLLGLSFVLGPEGSQMIDGDTVSGIRVKAAASTRAQAEAGLATAQEIAGRQRREAVLTASGAAMFGADDLTVNGRAVIGAEAYALVQALGERGEGFGILHIDAHCDLRRAYEGFEYSHASIMYNVLRDVPQAERIVEVGVRDYCDAEAELARSSERIRMFDDTQLSAAAFEGETWGATCRRIVAELPERVYVSFDIDGLSVEYCPHTGTPVAGGLTFNQAVYLLHETVRSGRRIIGFDVVEVVPRPGSSIDASTGARILYKLCGLTLKSEL